LRVSGSIYPLGIFHQRPQVPSDRIVNPVPICPARIG
jgi:hypothetical protein